MTPKIIVAHSRFIPETAEGLRKLMKSIFSLLTNTMAMSLRIDSTGIITIKSSRDLHYNEYIHNYDTCIEGKYATNTCFII